MQSKNLANVSPCPLVTIRCITYNHEPYIRQCLEGFVMQKTTFPFEAIVHDDASTDGTATIIREYAEKYPNIIKPIYETENQYSKHDGSLSRIMNKHMRGKYIAMCEGDDYWTDPLKLQKQVDLLENNPLASLCCGGYISKQIGAFDVEHIYRKGTDNYFLFSLEDWGKVWYTKTMTVVYRAEAAILHSKNIEKYYYNRDIHLFYNLLKWGDGIYLSDCLGVYNIHVGGVCSLVSKEQNAVHSYNCYKELFYCHHDDFSRRKYYFAIINRMLYGGKKRELFIEGWHVSVSCLERFKLLVLLFSPSLILRKMISKKNKIK